MLRKPTRAEPRYKVRNIEFVDVTVRQDSGTTDAALAEVRDLSRGGASLVVTRPLQFQEALLIKLESAKLGLDLSISAEVCWIRSLDEGRWLLGCSFAPPLPPESLEKLFVSGLLERRSYRRHQTRMAVTAQWELDTNVLPAFLWDISEGGFCILSPQPSKTGRRVLICAQGANEVVQIPAKTQWEMKVGDGWVVGCEFATREGYSLVQKLQSQTRGEHKGSERRTAVGRAFRAIVDSFQRRERSPAK